MKTLGKRGRLPRAMVLLAIAAVVSGQALGQAPPSVHVTRQNLPDGGVLLEVQAGTPSAAAEPSPESTGPFTFTKAVDRHRVPIEGQLRYRFSVTNDGTSSANGVVMTDTDLVAAILDGRFQSFIDVDVPDIVFPPASTVLIVIIFSPSGPSFIHAGVDALPPGTTFAWTLTLRAGGHEGDSVTNQASLQLNCSADSEFSANGCQNPTVALSDDPDTVNPQDPTTIVFISPRFAPAIRPLGFVIAAAGLLLFGLRRLGVRRRGCP